ncbi:hypothetical protein [Bifidobacterium merycicum]|uniref:hypothetical protein n=1 Tax=Bifidobacterium merycicum TaxID=78345 RepID=UPI00131AEEB4|nr:hypothetical protein [Bifidobacterium merycicum]MBQ1512788.1 hypothetical protein [Bifidobacterium sp.]MEE1294976.1 hypothetical protein [Bifidobacterium merycicum]
MSIQSLLSEIFFPRSIVLNGVHRLAMPGAFQVHFHNRIMDAHRVAAPVIRTDDSLAVYARE